MQLNEIAAQTINDTLKWLWPYFAPELILAISIMVMLIVRVVKGGQYVPGWVMAIIASTAALVSIGIPQDTSAGEMFTGMLVYDSFTVFLRAFLLVFVILFSIFTRLSRVPHRDDAVDFYCLVLGATLGMCLMASANHLLMVFMAVEMASVPSYALAGQMKTRRKSSEAALKYSIYGAGAAGIMLYGISLVAGVLNTAHLPTIAMRLTELDSLTGYQPVVLAMGGVMIMVGLAFKLSAVPFHFWCPDVFEGAGAEINAFLSVASKAGALALLVRVAVGFGYLPSHHGHDMANVDSEPTAVVAAESSDADSTVMVAQHATDGDHAAMTAEATPAEPLAPVREYIVLLVGLIAAVTCTFGNLAAYGQTNINRLMAYSTIAHAGYMMMAVPAAIAAGPEHADIARYAISGLLLYAAIYLLMNLGAFAIIAFLRNSLGTEEIQDYAGLIRRSPVMVICFTLILFSLVGLPPLAGFIGKFAIFAALAQSWKATGGNFLMFLLVVGGVNTAISLFYYLRVVKVMTIDPEPDTAPAASNAPVSFLAGTFVVLLTLPIAALILNAEGIAAWTKVAAEQLF